MTDHFTEFPYEEIRRPNGDFFYSWKEAADAGYMRSQIWSVVESEGTFTYGPPHHFVNAIGYIATVETHDNETYYHEVFDDDDDTCRTCGEAYDGCGDGWDGECPDCADRSFNDDEEDSRICSECGSMYDPDDSDFGTCADCEDMT